MVNKQQISSFILQALKKYAIVVVCFLIDAYVTAKRYCTRKYNDYRKYQLRTTLKNRNADGATPRMLFAACTDTKKAIDITDALEFYYASDSSPVCARLQDLLMKLGFYTDSMVVVYFENGALKYAKINLETETVVRGTQTKDLLYGDISLSGLNGDSMYALSVAENSTRPAN